jgi:polysaccharide pyruvyl transferase WcaK-like protein
VHILNETLPPDLLRACYREMDLFIASRLHSGIFALCENVPTVFIGYLSKTVGLLQALGLENWGIELAELTEIKLWERVKKAWERRKDLKTELQKLMPEVIQQARSVSERILKNHESDAIHEKKQSKTQ